MQNNEHNVTVNAPLYRDPIYDAPTDPVIVWNNKEKNYKKSNRKSKGCWRKKSRNKSWTNRDKKSRENRKGRNAKRRTK